MRLVSVDLKSIKLGVPLPFGLVDSRGVLLARKGFIFGTEKILINLANRGNGFFGSFVKLTSGEIAIVMHRGRNAGQPIVATVLQQDGSLSTNMQMRYTSDKRYAITKSVSLSQINVNLNLDDLLMRMALSKFSE